MSIGSRPICYGCKRFKGPWSCDAYKRIPAAIIKNRVDHRRAHPGDGGVTFTPTDTGAMQYASQVFAPPTKGALLQALKRRRGKGKR